MAHAEAAASAEVHSVEVHEAVVASVAALSVAVIIAEVLAVVMHPVDLAAHIILPHPHIITIITDHTFGVPDAEFI